MATDGNSSNPPPNFSWVEPGVLAGSGCPMNKDHYKFLSDNGVRKVITLKEEFPSGSKENCDEYNLERSRVGIKDFHPPTLEQIKEFIELTEEAVKSSQPAVVHCAQGKGRTGTMLACYLVKQRNMSAQEAIEEIRKIRPHSVETKEQEKAIADYCASLKDKK